MITKLSQDILTREGYLAKFAGYDFSSTQINLDPVLSKKIVEYSQKIPEIELYEDPSDRSFGRESNPHITVLYGIHTEKASVVREVLRVGSPFTVKFGAVSIFDNNDKYDVVKVNIVDSPGLHTLNKYMRKKLDCTVTFPKYNPHATIAYVQKGFGKKYVGSKFMNGQSMKVNEIAFCNKNGTQTTIRLDD